MTDQTDHFGWWLASDGKWYPPELHPMAGESARNGEARTVAHENRPAPGWWIASDGMWYPPELHPMAGEGSEADGGPDDALPAPVGDTDQVETPGVPSSAAAGPVIESDTGPDTGEVAVVVDAEVAETLDHFANMADVPASEPTEAEVEAGAPEARGGAVEAVEVETPEEVEPAPEGPDAPEADAEPAAANVAPPEGWAPAPFSSSDWLPGGPFGVDPATVRPEVSGRAGRRRRRKH